MTPYSFVAGEYYNPALHPTCANFDNLSRRFLEPEIGDSIRGAISVLEVGAGRSVVAPTFEKLGVALDLTLLDSSKEMLASSSPWAHLVKFIIADSRSTGLPSGSVDLLVSSLGDPYNTAEFWQEVSRLLKDGGCCLFTTPTPEWALHFRATGHLNEAEFVLADSSIVNVPSFVPSPEEQKRLFTSAGLCVEKSKDFSIRELAEPVSEKLKLPGATGKALAVLRGFRLRKLR
jgi:SAM-dependent methyltransferase